MRRSLLLLQYYDNNKRLGAELLKRRKKNFFFFPLSRIKLWTRKDWHKKRCHTHRGRERETWRAYLYIMGQSIIKTELSRKQSNSRYGQASNRWKQWFSLRASRVRSVFPKQMQSRQPENLDVIVFQDSSDYIWAPNSLESPFLLVPFTLRHSYSPNIEDKKNGREKRFFNQISLSLSLYTLHPTKLRGSSFELLLFFVISFIAFRLLAAADCPALFSTPSSSVVILSRPVRPPPPYISSVRYQREFFF